METAEEPVSAAVELLGDVALELVTIHKSTTTLCQS